MQTPAVSFVVPCYQLAHFLSECIDSILAQTFQDFEVLVMDDCSPDHTADVVKSYQDPRIRYIANDTNLGALRNWNKGIGLSRGKYVWLISADDYLRRPYVLQRYVALMETHPHVGYAFCSGVSVRNGRELEEIAYSRYGRRDRIVKGHIFLKKILDSCFILAPSALVRRACYEKLGLFPTDLVWAGKPLDLIWAGDWYLWCLFALHFDVAYFAEPMVCYREHDLAITNMLTAKRIEKCLAADIAVPWMIKQKAEQAGFKNVARSCLSAVAGEYARQLTGKWYRSSRAEITCEQFEASLCANTRSERERRYVRAQGFARLADDSYAHKDLWSARKYYRRSLSNAPQQTAVCAKLLLLLFGRPGAKMRRFLGSCRARFGT